MDTRRAYLFGAPTGAFVVIDYGALSIIVLAVEAQEIRSCAALISLR